VRVRGAEARLVRAIDCWVNVTMGEQKPPEYPIRVKEDCFKGGVISCRASARTGSTWTTSACSSPSCASAWRTGPIRGGRSRSGAVDLREGVLDEYPYANAVRLFFAPRRPRAA
jgi:hypothetical protein